MLKAFFEIFTHEKSELSCFWMKRQDWKQVIECIYLLQDEETSDFLDNYTHDIMVVTLVNRIKQFKDSST